MSSTHQCFQHTTIPPLIGYKTVFYTNQYIPYTFTSIAPMSSTHPYNQPTNPFELTNTFIYFHSYSLCDRISFNNRLQLLLLLLSMFSTHHYPPLIGYKTVLYTNQYVPWIHLYFHRTNVFHTSMFSTHHYPPH